LVKHATQYPTALDSFSNLTESNGSPANVLQNLANLNDAVEALQSRGGYDNDGITGRHFHKTVTLTSAAAVTPVEIIPNALVGAAQKIYVQGFVAKNDGATEWATTATVKIQDKEATPVDFVTIAVAALTANAKVFPLTANVTNEDAFVEGSGGTAGKGLQVAGDANGTGSDLKVTVWGVIR
jgi:hypothetical protein